VIRLPPTTSQEDSTVTSSLPTEPPTAAPLWVEIVTPQDVVAAGLRTILETELGSMVFTTVGPVDGEPDVVLYDVIGLHEGDGADLDHWIKQTGSTVIAVSRELRPDLGAIALDRGAEAVVSIGVSTEDLVEVIRAAVEGTLDDSPAVQEAGDALNLGAEAGLSLREVEVLRLIAQGVTNHDIAGTLFLSINSVKTYIRSTYRKIGVANRAQAVAWALQNGFPAEQDLG
jgi:DNA-binding NarL/FixJ family response regulator